MKRILPLLGWLAFTLNTQAGSCPDACQNSCGTKNSCCPAQGKRCSSVQLERGGNPSSAYASKSGLRLR